MPSGTTPNLGMSLPTPGGDNNNWGNIINANYTALDALFPSTPGTLADNTVPRYTSLGAIVAAGMTIATTADPTTTQVAITLDGSNNLDVTMATGGAAMEISQATGVVNFDKVPTVGGVSMPAGLGIGEIRTGLGTSDVVYSTGEAWLVCSGRALTTAEQTTYAAYVAAHGTNVPNMGAKTPRGYLAGTTPAPNTGVGNDNVSLVQANLPSHTHTLTSSSITSTDSGHQHNVTGTVTTPIASGGGNQQTLVGTPSGQAAPLGISGTAQTASASITSTLTALNLSSVGSGTSFSVVPSSTIITYFVRVA